jgi:RNA polymerase subunit RPABC4/transcription elongation factor Spt4
MCGHNPLHHVTHYAHPEHVQPAVQYAEPQIVTRPCPTCGAALQEDFVFCPRCGAEILTACPSCHRAVQTDWARCPHCGVDLLAGKAAAAPHSHT